MQLPSGVEALASPWGSIGEVERLSVSGMKSAMCFLPLPRAGRRQMRM